MPLLDATTSSSSSPSTHQYTDEGSDRNDNNLCSNKIRAKRRPIPRKGHTKSRLGCFNCKRRKIKCQETRPECPSCVKAGIRCEYPRTPRLEQELSLISTSDSMVDRSAEGHHISPSPALSLQSTPVVFSMDDLQYFHHFLVRGYPHLPVRGESVWKMDVPVLAHRYDYLIHSMLGLGASRLALTCPGSAKTGTSGLAHRVKAVELLGSALKHEPRTREEADARFATLMVLTFQSSCLEDGLVDFLTMLRGCVLSGSTIHDKNASCFASFMQKQHLTTMEDEFDERQMQNLRRDPLDAAVESLARLQPYCQSGAERSYFGLLSNLINASYNAPKQAYIQFLELYNVVGWISAEEFSRLVDKSNAICQILLAHWLAIHHILRPVTSLENPSREMSPMYHMIESWCCKIHAGLDPSFQHLNDWPMSFIYCASPWSDIEFNYVSEPMR